MTSQHSFKTVC